MPPFLPRPQLPALPRRNSHGVRLYLSLEEQCVKKRSPRNDHEDNIAAGTKNRSRSVVGLNREQGRLTGLLETSRGFCRKHGHIPFAGQLASLLNCEALRLIVASKPETDPIFCYAAKSDFFDCHNAVGGLRAAVHREEVTCRSY